MYVVIPEYFVLRDRSPLFQWCWPVNLCFFFADSLSFLAKETKLWLFHRFFVRDRAHSNRRSLFSGVQTFLAIMCIFGDFEFCLFLNSQPGVYTDTDPLHDYRNPFFFYQYKRLSRSRRSRIWVVANKYLNRQTGKSLHKIVDDWILAALVCCDPLALTWVLTLDVSWCTP